MKQLKKGYSDTVTAICADCNGEGVIITPGQKIGHNRWEEDKEEVCETCEGECIVVVKKRVSINTIIIPKSKANDFKV